MKKAQQGLPMWLIFLIITLIVLIILIIASGGINQALDRLLGGLFSR